MRALMLVMFLMITLEVCPQDIRVRNVKRITPENKGSYLLTGTVPGTDYLLVAGGGYNGLSLLNIRNGTLRPVSDEPGAGYEPAATADGKKIFYRSDCFTDNMKYSSVYCYDIESGEKELMMTKSRDVLSPAVTGNTVMLKSEGGMKIEQAGPVIKSGGSAVFLVVEDLLPVIYIDGKRNELKPNGDGFYIWASLSPDGTMILYNYQGRGTFICDLSGKIIHKAGKINAPRWFNNRLVIGMDDKDDGYRITSSELVYYSLDDMKLSSFTSTPDRSEMFPFASGNRRIAFCTDNGELYIMKVRVR
jgi:Tol biopolymer transport system component